AILLLHSFFFQAEDGIRDFHVTGVQTCALPILQRDRSGPRMTHTDWPLWEVFVRSRRGLSHTHAGSLHAPDAELALRNARDLYTRRGEGVSLWVVPSSAITASSPDEKDPFFEPSA